MQPIWIAAVIVAVSAMGYLDFPTSRNRNSPCAHCATGHDVCGNGDSSYWTESHEPSQRMSATIDKITVLYGGGTLTIGIYIMASPGGVMVLELCSDPGETIENSCFKRLERDPTDTQFSPYLPELPTHIWLTTTSSCTNLHTPTTKNPMQFRFKIPNGHFTEHAILRLNWQMSTACCAHPYLCAATFDERLKRFVYTEKERGVPIVCDILPTPSSPCGQDCPNAQEEGCNVDYSYIRNCADVAVRQKNQCTGTSCPNVIEGNEQVIYPGKCSQLTGKLEDCNEMRSWFPKDHELCVGLCQQLFDESVTGYAFWCKLRGHCSVTACAAAFSYDKCLLPGL